MAVERPRDVDAFQDRVRIEVECVRHVADPLGPEGLLGINPDRVAVHPAVVLWAGDVHRELMPDLGLSAPELAVHLRDRLCLEAAPEELVQSLRTGRELR